MPFNREGILTNINEKACQTYECDRQELIDERISYHDMFDIELPMEELDGFYFTQVIDIDKIAEKERKLKACKRKGRLLHEVHLMTVYEEDGQLMGMFAVGRDMTDRMNATNQQIHPVL